MYMCAAVSMATFIKASAAEFGCTRMTCGLSALTRVELQQMVVEVCSKAHNSGEFYSMETPTVLCTPSVMHRRSGCDVLPLERQFVTLQRRRG